MLQRIVAGGLWAFFGWYLVAHIASLTGLPLGIAPIGALVVAAVAFVDWPSLARRVAAAPASEPIREPR